ncbi:MAG: ABC transporter ATP-binding protein [Lachnospiraceae bacterium]|nr:ABC transporter ATP-binding protein [Lachnospiraceae bacterium]
MSLLEVKNVKKVYTTRFGAAKVQALCDVNFSVEEGEYVAVMGESGSGKTTLLNILASLDKATSGQVLLDGRDLTEIRHREICAFRREHLGFVFQDFNLLDTLSLKDNIYLPLVLAGADYREMEKRLLPLARKLDIGEILEKFPYEVSGGQKQRAAVCRALITEPDIILADEPTGALDSKAAGKLLRLFSEVNREGQTILMVTHSIQAASHAGRVLFIKDGCVFHQIYKGNQSNEAMYKMISDALTVLQTQKEDGADTEQKTEASVIEKDSVRNCKAGQNCTDRRMCIEKQSGKAEESEERKEVYPA